MVLSDFSCGNTYGNIESHMETGPNPANIRSDTIGESVESQHAERLYNSYGGRHEQ